MAPRSLLIHVDDDPNVADIIGSAQCSCRAYGLMPDSNWRLADICIETPATRFRVIREDRDFGTFRTGMIGRHNLKNILAAIAVADHLEVPPAVIAEALERFSGVKRRQEIRGEKRGIVVIDDFAHHPTAVRETLGAVREHFPENRLIAVFEPRTHSSMRKVFQQAYVSVFDPADRVCIRKPSLLSKVPENERLSSRTLVEDLIERGKDATHFEDTQNIIDDLTVSAAPGDVILIMSNGGFDNIHEKLLESF